MTPQTLAAGVTRFRASTAASKLWPLTEEEVRFSFPARHVAGNVFASSAELEVAFAETRVERLSLILSA